APLSQPSTPLIQPPRRRKTKNKHPQPRKNHLRSLRRKKKKHPRPRKNRPRSPRPKFHAKHQTNLRPPPPPIPQNPTPVPPNHSRPPSADSSPRNASRPHKSPQPAPAEG